MSSCELHCKNVPSRVQKTQWYGWVNKHSKGKKWLKNYKNNNEWVIVIKLYEKEDWFAALNNKSIQQQKIHCYFKGAGGGRDGRDGRDRDNNTSWRGRGSRGRGNRGNRGRGSRGRGRGSYHHRSAFNYNSDRRNDNKYINNKYNKIFTKHLTNKQQQDMLQLCGKRYNVDNKMLNLSGIIVSDQEHWASFSNQSFVQHLLNIIKQNCKEIKSLDLGNNNIYSLEPLKKMYQFAPFLENLSLLNNPIKSLSEINYLNTLKNNLRELYLRNLNLLNEVNGIKQLYVFEIYRRFPSLRLLDGEVIDNSSLISFGTNLDSLQCTFRDQSISLPVSPHEPCSNQSQIQQFINNYYQLFDTDRRKIINLYHIDAIFTLSYTPNYDTPSSSIENKSNNHRDVNKSCNMVNRNLIDDIFKTQPRFKQLNRVKHGNLDIIKYLNQEFIKKTKHQISYMSIDCHPINLNINNQKFMNVLINGYYAENQDVARKFNRNWLLMQDNNGIIIVNDQLHLGGVIPQTKLIKYAPASSIADLNNQTMKGNGNNISSNDIQIEMNNNSNNPNNNNQQDLIQKVANHCKCPINISRQALEASNWDPAVAVTKIETLKSQQRNGGNK